MEYSSAKFNGSYVDGRFEDTAGTYVYQDGTKFIGSLKNGAFHGPGRLLFKGGEYVGVFEKGKATSGEYVFYDDLKYSEENWDYCNGKTDRRFQSERASNKINPAPVARGDAACAARAAAGDVTYTLPGFTDGPYNTKRDQSVSTMPVKGAIPSFARFGDPPTHRFHPGGVRRIASIWKVMMPWPNSDTGARAGSAPGSAPCRARGA